MSTPRTYDLKMGLHLSSQYLQTGRKAVVVVCRKVLSTSALVLLPHKAVGVSGHRRRSAGWLAPSAVP